MAWGILVLRVFDLMYRRHLPLCCCRRSLIRPMFCIQSPWAFSAEVRYAGPKLVTLNSKHGQKPMPKSMDRNLIRRQETKERFPLAAFPVTIRVSNQSRSLALCTSMRKPDFDPVISTMRTTAFTSAAATRLGRVVGKRAKGGSASPLYRR